MLNASASAQMLSDIAFRALLNKCAVVYIDDLFTYSPDQNQHLHDSAKLFACIRKAGFLNPKKCKFNASAIKFLGFIVNEQGIHTDPAKIELSATKNITQAPFILWADKLLQAICQILFKDFTTPF